MCYKSSKRWKGKIFQQLNKALPPPFHLEIYSSSTKHHRHSTPPLLPHQAAFVPADPRSPTPRHRMLARWPPTPLPSPDLISSFVFYLRRRQGTYPSVVQNVLHHLGRPIYNCLEQSFHPGVSASDAPTALVGELIMAIASVVLMFIQSLNLLVILSCSEDLSATWLFNI
jgi:hypothetical protein